MRRITIWILVFGILASSLASANHVILLGIDDKTPPETMLTASQLSGNVPLTVVFTALCTDDIQIASCVLAFGDGSNQILQKIQLPQTVTHTYTKTGNFMATLTATDWAGNSDQTPALITINAVSPNAEPQTFLQAFPISGESPLEVTFIATCRDDDGAIVSCELDFGDGSRQSLQNIETPQTVFHTYENKKEITSVSRAAILTAKDDKGGADQTPAGILVTVFPGFGKDPETFINAFPFRGKSPLLVNFDALCFSADLDVSSCIIDFGDGERQNLLNVETPQQISHVYINTEVNEIRRIAKVRAADEKGNIDATPAEVTIVVETDIGNAPETNLQATPASGNSPLQVTFQARCRDLQRRLVECRLDFGDGQFQSLPTVETIQTVTHIYPKDGSYIATLNARDAEGLIDLTPSSVPITVGLASSQISVVSAAEKKRLLEFGIDIANLKEEETFSAAKRLFNGLLFGSNEIKMNIPKSFVKEIAVEVKKTNRLGELVIMLDDKELFRGKPEANSAQLKTVNFAADKKQITIPVNEEIEGVLKIRTTSSGFVFWAPAVYDVKVSVAADVQRFAENEFDFVLDKELTGFKSAKVVSFPKGATIMLNDNMLESAVIPVEYFSQLNRIKFTPAQDTAVQGKVSIEIVYIENK